MSDRKSVLFVCTGNTCRSPLAEGLFRLAAAGRDDLDVGSAGVAASKGEHASRDTVAVLKKRGGALDGFGSRPVTRETLESSSHIFAMTAAHLAVLERRFPEFSDRYYLLGEFANPSGTPSHADIPDPIGMGRAAYEETAAVLESAMPAIIAYIDRTATP